MKQSGFGREGGREGLMEYFQAKTLMKVPYDHHEGSFLKAKI